MEELLRFWRERLASEGEAVSEEFQHVLNSRIVQGEPPRREWAELAERAGCFGLAFREYQRLLGKNPDDIAVLERLTALYEERGELDRAIECAERTSRLLPGDVGALRRWLRLLLADERFEQAEAVLASSAEAMGEEVLQPLQAELRGVLERVPGEDDAREPEEEIASEADAVRFAHLFQGRENLYARQWWGSHGEGGYSPVREPFSPRVALQHLNGSITVGVYPIRLDGTVVFGALDLDVTKRALAEARGSPEASRRLRRLLDEQARRWLAALEKLGLSSLYEDSGYKGRHLWFLLAEPEPAVVVRQFGLLFVKAHPLEHRELAVEIFPKQAETGTGIGNLIKLPLGIHRRTGRRSRLLQADGQAVRRPLAYLKQCPRIRRTELHAAIAELKQRETSSPPGGPTEPPPWSDPTSSTDSVEERTLPEPPPLPPVWTSEDFSSHPEVGRLILGCPVLAKLRSKAEEHRRLDRDERVVLQHTLGYLPAGVLAVNYLFDLCVDVPSAERLQTPFRGNPISCPKIRKRIPQVTSSVPCHCEFPWAPERYPTPLLHLQNPKLELPKPPESEPMRFDPVERARVLGNLWRKRQQLEQEIAALEAQLVEYLDRQGGSLELEEGRLELERAGLVPALKFVRRGEASEPASGEPNGGHP